MEINYVKLNQAQKASEIDSYTLMRYAKFVELLPKDSEIILDYGCNTGRGGLKLRQHFEYAQIFGCDIVPHRLSEVPDGVYNLTFDLNQIKLTEAIKSKVDAIVSGEVVEHIPLEILIDIFKIFFNILNDDGIILITTPNPNSLLVKMGRDAVLKDPSHVNIMSAGFLTTLIRKLGFSQVKVIGAGKASKYLGNLFPLFFYGSYMLVIKK